MNQKQAGSTGEKLIRRVLQHNNIRFIFDAPISFAFDTYPKELSRKRFDFVIINDNLTPIACIEYDGQQHYEPNWYGRSISEFMQACESDNAKTRFCEQQQLPLLRIRYDQEDLIEDIVDTFLQYPARYKHKTHNPEFKMNEYWSPRSKYLCAQAM